jgi:hypothetical protein
VRGAQRGDLHLSGVDAGEELMITTALWVLVLFGFPAAVATFVWFTGGALVAWMADMATGQEADE